MSGFTRLTRRTPSDFQASRDMKIRVPSGAAGKLGGRGGLDVYSVTNLVKTYANLSAGF